MSFWNISLCNFRHDHFFASAYKSVAQLQLPRTPSKGMWPPWNLKSQVSLYNGVHIIAPDRSQWFNLSTVIMVIWPVSCWTNARQSLLRVQSSTSLVKVLFCFFFTYYISDLKPRRPTPRDCCHPRTLNPNPIVCTYQVASWFVWRFSSRNHGLKPAEFPFLRFCRLCYVNSVLLHWISTGWIGIEQVQEENSFPWERFLQSAADKRSQLCTDNNEFSW